jgi:hypothetical protein
MLPRQAVPMWQLTLLTLVYLLRKCRVTRPRAQAADSMVTR